MHKSLISFRRAHRAAHTHTIEDIQPLAVFSARFYLLHTCVSRPGKLGQLQQMAFQKLLHICLRWRHCAGAKHSQGMKDAEGCHS